MRLFGGSKDDEWAERLKREKLIRVEAERLLEEKSREIYIINQNLLVEKKNTETRNAELLEKQEEIIAQEEELRQTVEELLSMNEELEKTKRQLLSFNEKLRESEQELERKVEQRTHDLLIAKESAERANKVKSEFLANMSHELRTPLNGILGYAQIMVTQESIPQEAREKIAVIKKCGDHLLQLINSVLDLSKIEAGMMKLEFEEFELASFSRSVYEMFAVQCKNKNISLSFDVGAECPKYLSADQRKLKQCIINLVGNAIKFTSQGGVTISFKSPKVNRLQITIADTGRGIPKDKIESVLRPFEQVTEHNNTEGGTGLGLSITKSFIELMGGSISLESEVNKGTTVTFDISITRLDTISDITEGVNREIIGYTSEKPIKILVVDDNEVNVAVAEQILSPLYFETEKAFDGQEAIQKFLVFQPDLILMDIRMPNIDGLQATHYIRNMIGGNAVKIIAVTAHAFENERSEFLDKGCDDCIIKPYQKQDLLLNIGKHLSLKFVYAENSGISNTLILEKSSSDDTYDLNEIASMLPADLINQMDDNIISARLDAVRNDLDSFSMDPKLTGFKNYLYPLLDEMNFDELESILIQLKNIKQTITV